MFRDISSVDLPRNKYTHNRTKSRERHKKSITISHLGRAMGISAKQAQLFLVQGSRRARQDVGQSSAVTVLATHTRICREYITVSPIIFSIQPSLLFFLNLIRYEKRGDISYTYPDSPLETPLRSEHGSFS